MKKRIINISSSEYEELIKVPPIRRYIELVEYPSTTFFVEKIMPSKKWGHVAIISERTPIGIIGPFREERDQYYKENQEWLNSHS